MALSVGLIDVDIKLGCMQVGDSEIWYGVRRDEEHAASTEISCHFGG